MTTKPTTLGGFTLPADNDAQGWHDLAVERARVERIPTPWDLAEVQAILDHHGITLAEIRKQIAAEQAAMADGSLVPISSGRRPDKGSASANPSATGKSSSSTNPKGEVKGSARTNPFGAGTAGQHP